MAHQTTRRAVLAAAVATGVAGCVGGEAENGNTDQYDDEESLIPPDDLLGDDWERVPDEESTETERAYESENGYVLVDVRLADPDADLETAFDDLSEEMFVTGEEVDIGDEALYDEVDGFAGLAVRDKNAIGLLMGAQMAGFSMQPARTTVLDGGRSLVDHWRENA